MGTILVHTTTATTVKPRIVSTNVVMPIGGIARCGKEQTMSEHDCSKCPYKRLCEKIEIKDLSCDDIKVIAQGSAEIGSLYEICEREGE